MSCVWGAFLQASAAVTERPLCAIRLLCHVCWGTFLQASAAITRSAFLCHVWGAFLQASAGSGALFVLSAPSAIFRVFFHRLMNVIGNKDTCSTYSCAFPEFALPPQ